jgi:hypothetical protein
MTDQTKDMPTAFALDEWWKASTAVDKEASEEAAVRAKDFQEQRVQTYLESAGQTDIGGWVGSAPGSYGARGIYQARGRQWDWR